MADIIFPDGTLLGDLIANLNTFSSNPASSRGEGEIIYNTTDDNVYKNTGTAGTPVWVSIGGLTPSQITDLTDSGDSTLHYHQTDRDATDGADSDVDTASESKWATITAFVSAITALQGLGTDEIQWYINYGQASGSPNTFNLDLIFDRGSLGDAILRWNETTDEFEFLDAGGASKTNIHCSTVNTTSGIVLDADETTPKVKIFDEGGAGTKNMVFEVETGQSFVFRTVA